MRIPVATSTYFSVIPASNLLTEIHDQHQPAEQSILAQHALVDLLGREVPVGSLAKCWAF